MGVKLGAMAVRWAGRLPNVVASSSEADASRTRGPSARVHGAHS